MNLPQSAFEEDALLALRRTLWQLAVVGVVAAIVVELFASALGAAGMWCALAPATALAVHLRSELMGRWAASGNTIASRARMRHGVRERRDGRRRPAMAVRKPRPSRLAGVR